MEALALVNLPRLMDQVDDLATAYRSGQPFPHIVLDDVLHPDVFERAVAEFPGIRDEFWKGYLHVNETKYSNTQPDSWGETLRSVALEFCSPPFVEFLTRLTGIENLMPDWSMDGGGLHQTLRGGHLNIHADFTTHHDHDNWARRVNILLYLNESWDADEWGGQLELWDPGMTSCQARVTPAGNRMLVFTTTFDSFHGHPDPLTCPEDVARRSMALYYFTEEEQAVRRSTNYQARPDESAFKKAAVWADRRALDAYDRVKRRLGVSDEAAQKLLARLDGLRRR
ncbi:2OG-Fe(II) oxygenase [Nocardioides sp. zg-1230]|uniref:2OG-Fe(II) oxygenase n=1 Tax=Nocardioides sp. zg-1230 TaxID=2736601 RepID=UPI001555FA76|nr:2OG-Fe(II) oxygenase [Nocardioides sp. zg-1230]NPC44299.1 2OG-Fe(II) oxygenase [Nocardioides sp. zg-1230]